MSKTEKKSTQHLILEAAVKIAREDGLEAVTHKVLAAVLEKSSSNIGYWFQTALQLRRAVALKLISSGTLQWGHIEVYVFQKVPGDHPQYPGPEQDSELSFGNLAVAEAICWLARNGVTEAAE